MCGIGVVFGQEDMQGTTDFDEFMKVVAHRGPDNYGSISLPNCILAHHRLSIIDLKEQANQPFIYKNWSIVFNGAIYNFEEIRSHLSEKGHTFITNSDTEVILHAFEVYGKSCLELFEGMWAFVIFDKTTNELWAVRDRFGIKPLYYSIIKGKIWIGSELKQFYRNGRKELNEAACLKFLNYGFLNTDEETLFQDVFQLEPGHSFTFGMKSKKVTPNRYYSLEKTEVDKEANLSQLIIESVKMQNVGEFQVATTLSGGLDSSILTSHQLTDHPNTKSFSYVPDQPALNESQYIDALLKKFPHENHRVDLPFEFLENEIEAILYQMDGPVPSISMIAQNMLYKLMQHYKVKVCLSGQGADEIFGGYYRNLSLIKWTQFAHDPIKLALFIKNNANKWLENRSKPKSKEVFKESSMPTFDGDSIQDYMMYQLSKVGLRDLLHYEDRNSTYYQIEARVPYLSSTLVEYAYNLPDNLKMKDLKRKGALLTLYKSVLPKEIINRKEKMAFDTPEKEWLEKILPTINEDFGYIKNKLPHLVRSNVNSLTDNHLNDVFLMWRIYFFKNFLTAYAKYG